MNKDDLLKTTAHLPHDHYWDGRCTRCGRIRRLCEALRQHYLLDKGSYQRCTEIAEFKGE